MNTRLYRADVLFEASINVCGSNFLVIYGHHVNGGYCSIPNWKIGCEMADPDDTFYNYERLHSAGLSKQEAKAVAEEIKRIAAEVKTEHKAEYGKVTKEKIPCLPVSEGFTSNALHYNLALTKPTSEATANAPLVVFDDKTFVLPWDDIVELAKNAGLFDIEVSV